MDLPFLWNPPAPGNGVVSLMSDEISVLPDEPPIYHGLEGNQHLQQPFVYKRVFSREQCERIKAIGRALPIWNGRSTADEDDYRVCKTSWIEETDAAKFVYDRLRAVVRSANALYRVEASGFGEPLHYIEYEAGGGFGWHTDLGAGPMSTRKLSISVQLTDEDEYAGGDLEFCPHGVIPEFRGVGHAIVFPSYIAHRVLPITSGMRQALVAWIHGPAFR
jgi:PKHD-type hydroxylase